MQNSRLVELSALEKGVNIFTKRLIRLTKQLKELDKKAESDAEAAVESELAQKLASKANKIRGDIKFYLKSIQEELQRENPGTDVVASVYYNYFLLKVAQYNAVFFSNKSAEEVVKEAGKKLSPSVLNRIGYRPINHELLKSANGTEMTHELSEPAKADRIFRDPIPKQYEGRLRYYYDEEQASDNYRRSGLSFNNYYKKANKKIGGGTQKSNVRNMFTINNLSQLAENFFRGKDITEQQREREIFKSAKKKIKSRQPLTRREKEVLIRGKHYRGSGAPLEFSLAKREEDAKAVHTHIAHAGQTIDMNGVIATVDPVHYDSGPSGNFLGRLIGKLLYPHKHTPGHDTDDYFTHVILITHGHYDHLDERTVTEILRKFGDKVLFVVSAGNGKDLIKWGAKNVREISTCNTSIKVKVKDATGKVNTLIIDALPARHANNREINAAMPDINAEFYTGYIMRMEGSSHATIVTGDTAVLDEEHFRQLRLYAIKHNVTFSSACIAAGPDRPRSWLDCTHQSSSDAMTYQARLNVINAEILALRRQEAEGGELRVTMEDLINGACEGVYYHHSCFRLGLLNYNDVQGTVTRMLNAMSFYKEVSVNKTLEILQNEMTILLGMQIPVMMEKLRSAYQSAPSDTSADLLNELITYTDAFNEARIPSFKKALDAAINKNLAKKEAGLALDDIAFNLSLDELDREHTRLAPHAADLRNFTFSDMDGFERLGLIQTLKKYNTLFTANNIPCSAMKLAEFIRSHTHSPKPGEHLNFNRENPGFDLAYKNLIVNRDDTHNTTRAYEFILEKFASVNNSQALMNKLAANQPFNERSVLKILMQMYLDKPAYAASTRFKKPLVKDFLKKIDAIDDRGKLLNALIQLRGNSVNWETADEVQRDEGHLETILLVAHGLLTKAAFRQEFAHDYVAYQNRQEKPMSYFKKFLIGAGATLLLTGGLVALSIFVPPVGLAIASAIAWAANFAAISIAVNTVVAAIAWSVVGAITFIGLSLGLGIAACKQPLAEEPEAAPTENTGWTPVALKKALGGKAVESSAEIAAKYPRTNDFAATKGLPSIRQFQPRKVQDVEQPGLPRRHSFTY